MIAGTRRFVGMVALVTYLVMGAMLYFTILPAADGLWPPDFHLRGYDATSIAPFNMTLRDEARATYAAILTGWDRVFIVAFALWLAMTGWRGGGLRYVVAGLAVVYAAIDLSENLAIHHFIVTAPADFMMIDVASHLTMAKFASLYLCVLVLIWHLRRAA